MHVPHRERWLHVVAKSGDDSGIVALPTAAGPWAVCGCEESPNLQDFAVMLKNLVVNCLSL